MIIPIYVDDETGDVQGYITPAQAAKQLDVDENLVRVWIKRKKLKVLKIGTNSFIKGGTPKPESKTRGRKPRGQNTSLSEG